MQRTTVKSGLWALALLVITFGCKPSKPEQPVTPQEAQQFAGEMQNAVEKRRPAMLNDIIDGPEFARRVAKNMDNAKVDKSMIKSVTRGVTQAGFGGKIVEAIGKNGSYGLVKVYAKNGRQHILFRMLGENGELNYHEFELLKRGGKIKTADIFIYGLGENFSATIAHLLGSTGSGPLSEKRAREIQKVSQVRTLIQKEKYEEAQEILDGISPAMQNQKSILILRSEVAAHISDSLYTAVLQELEKRYPGEPNMQLINMERHFMEKDYEKALESVNSLDRVIDKDPYLDYYRYLMLTRLKRDAEALVCLERVVEVMPDFSMAQLELMITYYDEGKKDKARKLKEAYRGNSRLNQEKLDNLLESYPGL